MSVSEKQRKVSTRNPGDIDDFVGLEMQLAKMTEERDIARQLAVKATNDLLEIRAQIDYCAALGTPSADILRRYAEAKKTLTREQEARRLEVQRDPLSKPTGAFHDAVKSALVLARTIADVLIGE